MAEQVAVNPAAEGASAGAEEEVEQAAGGESVANSADPDAVLAAEEEGEKAEGPKKRKIKLADKDLELDEETAALIEEREKVYQQRKEHTRAANERFQQAANVFKQIEGIAPEALAALRSGDPWQIAKALGKDPDALVTDYAKQKLAELEMSPEQRAFAEQQRQLESRAKALREQEQKIAQQQYQAQLQEVQKDFAKHLPVVLEKFGLPDDEFTAGEIGKTIAQMVRLTGRPPTPADYEEAAEVQAERLEQQLSRYLDRLARNPGALKKKFPEIAKRLREEDVASVTAPRAIRPGKPTNAPQTQPSRPKTYAEEEREARNAFYASLGQRR